MDKLYSRAIIAVRKSLMNNSDSKLLALSQLVLVFVGIISSFFASANIVPPPSADAQPSSISSSQNLSSNPGNSTDAQIAVYQNNVYIVWSDATTGNGDIYFKRSLDNGTSFGATENFSANPGNSTDAQIAVYQNNVYLVWSDATTGNGDIYFKRSVDNGTSFGTTENLSINSTELSSGPQISAVGGNVYLAWTEPMDGSNEIFFRYSNDSGVSFRGARELSKTLSVDGESALFPRISAIGGNVYVVWQDRVSGN